MIQDGIRKSQNCVVAKNKLTRCHDYAVARASLFQQCYFNVFFYKFGPQMRLLSDFPFLSPKVQEIEFLHFLAPGAQFSQNCDILTTSAISRVHELTYPQHYFDSGAEGTTKVQFCTKKLFFAPNTHFWPKSAFCAQKSEFVQKALFSVH